MKELFSKEINGVKYTLCVDKNILYMCFEEVKFSLDCTLVDTIQEDFIYEGILDSAYTLYTTNKELEDFDFEKLSFNAQG